MKRALASLLTSHCWPFLSLTLFPNDFTYSMEETSILWMWRALIMDELHL